MGEGKENGGALLWVGYGGDEVKRTGNEMHEGFGKHLNLGVARVTLPHA